MRHVITFLATGSYVGKIPLAPGTWGTAVGVLFYSLIHYLPEHAYIAMLVTFIILSVWVSNHAQKIFEDADPPQVVIDEIAGFLVTMAFHRPAWSMILCGFILFRVFDIIKPWPVSWIERRFDDGRGIVFDDVFAGIYANAALWIFEFLLPACGVKW